MQPRSHNIASRKVDATLRRMSIIHNRVKNVFKLHTFFDIFLLCTGNSLSDQHIVSPIQPNMAIDFVRFTTIFINCSEIQNLQNLCFEFQNCVNLKKNRCILAYLMTYYVDLSKNNLY